MQYRGVASIVLDKKIQCRCYKFSNVLKLAMMVCDCGSVGIFCGREKSSACASCVIRFDGRGHGCINQNGDIDIRDTHTLVLVLYIIPVRIGRRRRLDTITPLRDAL